MNEMNERKVIFCISVNLIQREIIMIDLNEKGIIM